MQIDRGSFLIALAGSFAAGAAPAFGRSERLYVSSVKEMRGISHVAFFTADGSILFKTELPDRGHDLALNPVNTDLVIFARRPGRRAFPSSIR